MLAGTPARPVQEHGGIRPTGASGDVAEYRKPTAYLVNQLLEWARIWLAVLQRLA